MGRKRQIKIEGAVDWHPRINDVPEDTIKLIRMIAAEKSTNEKCMAIGNLLRDWIVVGADKEAKKLKIGISG